MRETTKKQLLAVLEKQLAKVMEKLSMKHHDELREVALQMTELSDKLNSVKTEKAFTAFRIQYAKLELRQNKLWKVSNNYTKNLEKNLNEQWALEEEITVLKHILNYATPDLQRRLSYAATNPFSK